MRLDRLTPAHLRRAVAIYLDHAWPEDQPGKPKLGRDVLKGCETLEEAFGRCETPKGGETGPTAARYTLRLGNWRYAFMKLVIQEYMVNGEYFFSVDTHDDLKVTPDMPDYEGWCELRRFNARLKGEIEQAWVDGDLPTNANLRTLMEGMAEVHQGDAKGARLLVVDDEQDVARGLAAVLRGRGYQVETAFDGCEVLERMESAPAPDLLVLDYSMPTVNGEEVMAQLREQPAFRDLPILLATATEIDLSAMARASGLLRKPFTTDVLYKMIEELLAAARPDPVLGEGS